MRISDWSSDVCSSDLNVVATATGALSQVTNGVTGGATGGTPDGDSNAVTGLVTGVTETVGGLLGGLKPKDRKSVVSGKSVSVRVDLGGRRTITKKNNNPKIPVSEQNDKVKEH